MRKGGLFRKGRRTACCGLGFRHGICARSCRTCSHCNICERLSSSWNRSIGTENLTNRRADSARLSRQIRQGKTRHWTGGTGMMIQKDKAHNHIGDLQRHPQGQKGWRKITNNILGGALRSGLFYLGGTMKSKSEKDYIEQMPLCSGSTEKFGYLAVFRPHRSGVPGERIRDSTMTVSCSWKQTTSWNEEGIAQRYMAL